MVSWPSTSYGPLNLTLNPCTPYLYKINKSLNFYNTQIWFSNDLIATILKMEGYSKESGLLNSQIDFKAFIQKKLKNGKTGMIKTRSQNVSMNDNRSFWVNWEFLKISEFV